MEESREVQPYVELTYSQPPPAETPSGEEAPLAPGSAVKVSVIKLLYVLIRSVF